MKYKFLLFVLLAFSNMLSAGDVKKAMNCDSCLLVFKTYQYAFNTGMSIPSDKFDPMKGLVHKCYEKYKNANNCTGLNANILKISKIVVKDWNITKGSPFVYQFDVKVTIDNFTNEVKKQLAPNCADCKKEWMTFKKIIKQGNGIQEFKENARLQKCYAQRRFSCDKSLTNIIVWSEKKLNTKFKLEPKRIQFNYQITDEIGTLKVFKDSKQHYGILHQDILLLSANFDLIKVVKLEADHYIYTEKNNISSIYTQYGEKVIERDIKNLIVDVDNNLVKIKEDGKWQLFLVGQKKLLPERYDNLEGLKGGIIIMGWNNGKFMLLNRKGFAINNILYDYIETNYIIPKSDLIILGKNNKLGIVNLNGVELTNFQYDKIGYEKNKINISNLVKDRILVEIGNKFGYINPKGEELVPVIYDEIVGFGSNKGRFSEDFVVVKDKGKVGLINYSNGELRIPVVYDDIIGLESISTDYSYVVAKVMSQGKYGYINLEGEEIIPIKFDEIGQFKTGYASFKQGNYWGLMNSFGKVTIQPKYDEPIQMKGSEIYASLDGNNLKMDKFENRIYNNYNNARLVDLKFDGQYVTKIIENKVFDILGEGVSNTIIGKEIDEEELKNKFYEIEQDLENRLGGSFTPQQETEFVEIIKSKINLYKAGLAHYSSENTNPSLNSAPISSFGNGSVRCKSCAKLFPRKQGFGKMAGTTHMSSPCAQAYKDIEFGLIVFKDQPELLNFYKMSFDIGTWVCSRRCSYSIGLCIDEF